MKRRAVVLLFAVAAAIGLSLGPAGATGHHQHRADGALVVDNQARHGRSCLGTRDPFETIQGAVDAAHSGDTIRVCPGLYGETVKVQTERLTIKGANAHRDATRSGRHAESVVSHLDPAGTVQLLADDITWDGFTIRGSFGDQNGPGMTTSPSASGYLVRDTIFQDNGVGIHLGASGKHPSFVCRNRFVANNEFTSGGYGVYSNLGATEVLITYNRFERHNEAGIFFADQGATQQDVLIDHNKSIGDLAFASIFNTSRARISDNYARDRVGDSKFPGPASAIRIGARNDTITVHRNRVRSASGNGIDVTDVGEPGKAIATPTNVVVTKNKVDHAQLAGIRLSDGAEDVAVTANRAVDNLLLDCQDESVGGGTAGTNNAWVANFGRTDSPDGICTPPPTPTPGHGGHHHKPPKKHHKKKDPCSCKRHPRAF
jgi:Right handed beta helix region